MSDEYHWARDPRDLIEARLTQDEAEALASYRAAREQVRAGVKNLVMVLPISEQFLAEVDVVGSPIEASIREAAGAAAVDALRREISAVSGTDSGSNDPSEAPDRAQEG